MHYDYSKLLGLIKEKRCTQADVAKAAGCNKATFNSKINNKAYFRQSEMTSICDFLGLDYNDIGRYFFCPENSEN